MGIVRNLNMPQQNMQNSENVVDALGRRINWLHTLNISLQLSQAYISDNWYQGGSDYLAFFGNFLWDVNLNEFLHPKLIYQSTLNYKLAINSTSQDKYHKYAISQELFQYNTKFGYKARHNWYYSVTAQFKTQFLNSYGSGQQGPQGLLPLARHAQRRRRYDLQPREEAETPETLHIHSPDILQPEDLYRRPCGPRAVQHAARPAHRQRVR